MIVINSRFVNNCFLKCRPPLFELLLIIQHKSDDPAFHVQYMVYCMSFQKVGSRVPSKARANLVVNEPPLYLINLPPKESKSINREVH